MGSVQAASGVVQFAQGTRRDAIGVNDANSGGNVIPKAEGFEKSLAGMLSGAAEYWLASPARPRPTADLIDYWDALVGQWIEDPNLPLLIRKSGDRGLEHRHLTGRQVVCVDNSPAHWTLACAIRGQTPTVAELLAALQSGEWPVVFAMSKAEVAKLPRYRGLLARSRAAKAINDGQWKVCHIDDVGLRTKGAVTEVGISTLKEKCRRLVDQEDGDEDLEEQDRPGCRCGDHRAQGPRPATGQAGDESWNR